jgi:arylformamidase
MSGMYKMVPVRLSWRRTYVNFNDAMADAMSSQRHIEKLNAPIIVTYGTLDTPDFQRQSRDFAAAVGGFPVPNDLAGIDRPDLVDALVREIYGWAGLTPPG